MTAVVNSTDIVVERYEYTPHGQRTIFGRRWLPADADEDETEIREKSGDTIQVFD